VKTPDVHFPDPDFPDDVLLASYFAGEPDPAARAVVDAWVGNSQPRRDLLEYLRFGWESGGRAVVSGDVAKFTRALRERIAAGDGNGEALATRIVDVREAGKRNFWKPVLRRERERLGSRTLPLGTRSLLFGVLCTAAVVGLAQFGVRSSKENPVPTHTYRTGAGEHVVVTLSDGSRVHLAPRSRLTVPSAPNASTRSVTLLGEAYFEVEPRGRTPFVVQTGRVKTRVLGTTFDVRHTSARDTVHVAVFSGRVVTGVPGRTVTLAAGRAGHITDSATVATDGEDVSRYAGWTRGELAFDHASVREVLATAGRWYGYQFRLADSSMATQHVTILLRIAESKEALIMLRDLLDVTMTFDGPVVTLHPRRTSTTDAPTRRTAKDLFSISREAGK
jgi:ferric-dicitrate binding protein FerR (iron transport regulator)